jgi:hypothetical protein
VYDYASGEKEQSAVFWCRNLDPSRPKYALLFVFYHTEDRLTQCPDLIDWANYPGGLSIYRKRGESLEGFVCLRDPKRKLPRGARIEGNGILSAYGGVEVLFYCHQGGWLVWQRHEANSHCSRTVACSVIMPLFPELKVMSSLRVATKAGSVGFH